MNQKTLVFKPFLAIGLILALAFMLSFIFVDQAHASTYTINTSNGGWTPSQSTINAGGDVNAILCGAYNICNGYVPGYGYYNPAGTSYSYYGNNNYGYYPGNVYGYQYIYGGQQGYYSYLNNYSSFPGYTYVYTGR
ncbi:MAG: hypothetical protein PHF79_02650 [Candidatus Pacebacteria bacterium]|nr:hypothetical protein [Candidatus Paceibacterota bacterium]